MQTWDFAPQNIPAWNEAKDQNYKSFFFYILYQDGLDF